MRITVVVMRNWRSIPREGSKHIAGWGEHKPRHLPPDFSNLPKKYVWKRTTKDFISYKPPQLPMYDKEHVSMWREKPYYDVHRPWEDGFSRQNAHWVDQPDIFVEPLKDWHLYRGDRVEILRGKDKGKQGIVNYIVTERNWVFVEGLNLKFTLRNDTKEYPGILMGKEMPLLVPRDVSLVDPADRKPTEIEWRWDEEGNQVRVSVRTGRIIPIPTMSGETYDFKDKKLYLEHAKDTPADELQKITFKPALKTFEIEIMDEMGIKEERTPYPWYWY